MKFIQKIGFLLFFATILQFTAIAQGEGIINDYIRKYSQLAIAEMHRTGVPASIKLAQGIHETMAGTSNLVLKSNNHFGIKCKSDWQGPSVKHTDDAYNECFRKYDSPEDSYRDHSNFLRNNARYAFLFELDPSDYEGWAYGLKKAGYATNPRYAPTLIGLIEKYQLQDYSLTAPEKKPITIQAAPAASALPAPPEPVYPVGVFKINDTKVVYVKAGTPLLSLANQYDMPLERLLDFNDMPEIEVLEKNQLIYLQRKRRTGSDDYHIVKQGETLVDICRLQAIRLEALMELNLIKNKDFVPAVGEKIYLKEKASTQPKVATAATGAHSSPVL